MTRIEVELPVCRIVQCNDVVIVAWHATPTLEAINTITDVLHRAHKEIGTPISIVVLLAGVFGMPEADVRVALSEQVSRTSKFTHQLLLILEWEGFLAATLRSALAGVKLQTKQGGPSSVVKDRAAAVELLLKNKTAATPAQAQELMSAFELAVKGK